MESPLPNVKVGLDKTDILNWYCLVNGLEDPRFQGGQYIFHIRLSPRYPFEPPDFFVLTPNGRFDVNKKLCFSNSSYHPTSWSPIWNLRTIILGLLSFFLEDSSSGVGHITTTIEAKQNLAQQSVEYNQKHHARIMSLIQP